jgi:microcystin degradation protein MlrC
MNNDQRDHSQSGSAGRLFLISGAGGIFILFLLALAFPSCRKEGPAEAGKIRIAVATFSHETCTFCPDPTTVEDWEFYGPPTRDILDADEGYIGGFKRMCAEIGNVDLVGILSPRDARGGSSGSWLTKEAFDKYSGLIVEDLKKAGPLDGVFLALHGAMAVTDIPKPEAELAKRVRETVGKIPIMEG